MCRTLRRTYISPVVDRARNNVAILLGQMAISLESSATVGKGGVIDTEARCPQDIVHDVLGGHRNDKKPFWSVDRKRGQKTRLEEYNQGLKFGLEQSVVRADKRRKLDRAASHPNRFNRKVPNSLATPEETCRHQDLKKKRKASLNKDQCTAVRELKGEDIRSNYNLRQFFIIFSS